MKEIKEVKEEAPLKPLTSSSKQLKKDINISKWNLTTNGNYAYAQTFLLLVYIIACYWDLPTLIICI